MVLGKKGVSLLRLIIGFIALLVYAMFLPAIDGVITSSVPLLSGLTKWVVQLLPVAFLFAIIMFAGRDTGGGYV